MTLFSLIAGMGKVVKPPKDVTASVSGSDIVVSWTAATSVDSYNVYTSIDSGPWNLLGNEATTSHTFTPTTPGEYNFRVTSVRGTQESAPSAETLYDEMMEQVYSDTISGLRISAVDGTAFVDAASDITTYADGNHLIEIEDSLGNVASGVLSEQGSGETLGSELFPALDFTSGWAANNATVDDADTFTTTAAFGYVQKAVSGSKGGLYKILNFTTTETSGLTQLQNWISGAGLTSPLANHYATKEIIDGSGFRIRSTTTATVDVSALSIKQVTAPSTSGALIVSEIDGATQNFFDIETGFAFNEASYTVRVKKILPTA